MKTYKYDVAISLLKQDVDYARKLVKALNPRLKVFFYEDRQEDLVSKSGPEAFAKIFKEEARLVVILSRKEWSETFYTEIERNAIIDRTSIKGEGYGFLMVLPIEPGQAPLWYPSTYIYVNPRNFTIEQIARFIEFKVTELGGEVKPVTLEERIDSIKAKMEERKKYIMELTSVGMVKEGGQEIRKICDLFNKQLELIRKKHLQFRIHTQPLPETFYYSEEPIIGILKLEKKSLVIALEVESNGPSAYNFYSVQCYKVSFYTGVLNQNHDGFEEITNQKVYRYNKTNELNYGWSEELKIEGQPDRRMAEYLFQAPMNTYYYDLKEVITSEALIEYWFTELFKLVEEKFKPVLL